MWKTGLTCIRTAYKSQCVHNSMSLVLICTVTLQCCSGRCRPVYNSAQESCCRIRKQAMSTLFSMFVGYLLCSSGHICQCGAGTSLNHKVLNFERQAQERNCRCLRVSAVQRSPQETCNGHYTPASVSALLHLLCDFSIIELHSENERGQFFWIVWNWHCLRSCLL